MRRAIALGILALTALLANSAWAQAQSSTGQQAGLTNPGFEEPRVEQGRVELVETMPGWKTTDTKFEIWGSGFKDVVAHEGTQFVELNAYINGTLFQDSTGIPRGSVLEFTFAHRGRSGDDTMMLSIGDLGADNALGGGDDTVLFANQYTTGKDAWAVYDSTTEPTIKALGNTVMFAYSAISTATGELGEGNLLDAANFGIGVVSMQQAAAGIKVGSWEIHQAGPPVAFDTSDNAGMVSALDKATIPPLDDPEWKRTSDATVNVHEKSAITNKDKTTVDYTFFQVMVTVPEGAAINTFQVNFDQVDDAARIWIFNSKHPEGKYFPDADVLAGGQNVTVAADFKDEVAEGENRIVITQYDNYPVLNTIKGIHIIVDGKEVEPGTLPTTNSIAMEFKLIPAGTFLMGTADSVDEQQHEVTITRDYYIGVTEVTQSQWQQIMGTTPWKGQEGIEEGNDNPATHFAWNDAVEFCQKLSRQDGHSYRLPTEAEWEYACRAGSTTTYSFGDDASQLEQYAWYFDSKPNHPSQVKQKKPNGFGLYDVHGNVWELCQDWNAAYPQGSVTDPTGPSSGSHRVMRGGGFLNKAPFSRSAHRNHPSDMAVTYRDVGFRVVMVPGSDSGELAMNETEPAPPRRKLINASFEEPRGEENGFVMAPAMPGWNTTDAVFEIWSTGFEGFEAHDGTQFVELNARIDGTLYQDLTGIGQGAELDFSFAHRGRNGNDTMMLTITDLGIDNTIGSDDDRVLFVKEYTTGKEAWEVYTNTSEVPIVTLGNTIRFAYTAVYGTGGRGPDKTEGNFLDSVNFGVDVGRPATPSLTLEEAKQMLIGEWKADRAKTETRYGKLDFALRPLVCEGFLLKFSADNVFQLVTGNDVMSTSYKVEGPDDDNYFQVVTLQDGQELTEDVRIVDIHHIILKSRSGATPLMFFRHFEPEDKIGRVHKAPVEMVTAGDSETATGDDKELIITRDAEDQHGAVWTQDKLNFNEDFKISAEVYLGTKDDGADGMAMVFQVTGNDIVSTGSGIGYQGVSPSIAIEFDTYQNRDELNDPADDHVAVRTNGSPVHIASDYVEVGNLEDGKYHPMTFEWNAAKQTFNLTLDGKQLFKETSIPKNGLAGQQVYFGFTAATGLYSNLHKVRRISLSK